MDADHLSDPQRRALAVMSAALAGRDLAGRERRPVRTSNRTSKPVEFTHREMLTVHHQVADQLVELGLLWVDNAVIGLLELTDDGRAVAREVGL